MNILRKTKMIIDEECMLKHIDKFVDMMKFRMYLKNDKYIIPPKKIVCSSNVFTSEKSSSIDYGKIISKINATMLKTHKIARENYVICLYSGAKIELPQKLSNIIDNYEFDTEISTQDSEEIENFMNIINEEHVIPSSTYFRCKNIVNDIHNFGTVRSIINVYRQNYIFDEIDKINHSNIGFDDIIIANDASEENAENYAIINCNSINSFDENNKKLFAPLTYIDNCVFIRRNIEQIMKNRKVCFYPLSLENYNLRSSMANFKKKYGFEQEISAAISCEFLGSWNYTFSPAKTENLGTIGRIILYFHTLYRLKYGYSLGLFNARKNDEEKECDKRVFNNFIRKYDNFMTYEQLKLAVKWHLLYPPTEYEKNRNNEIYKAQGNYNPFVKDELKERIDILANTFVDMPFAIE